MSDALRLTITTPTAVLVDRADVRSVRAEDASGAFGILPGHTDLLTVLPASVVQWQNRDGTRHYCAVRAGVLTVSEGRRIAIACRQGTLGDDLSALEAEVEALRAAELDAERNARVEQLRLHARAVRQFLRHLGQGSSGDDETPILKRDL